MIQRTLKRLMLPALVFLLLALTIYVSWNNSSFIYKNTVRMYYRLFHAGDYELMYKEAMALYNRGEGKEFERKARLFMNAWPDKSSIRLLLGRYYIESGNTLEGAQLVLDSLSFDSSDTAALEEVLPVLHARNLHGDILAIMNAYSLDEFRTNGSILFYFGRALYEDGQFRKALDILSLVRSLSVRPEYLQTLALCYEKLADTEGGNGAYLENAALYIEMAYRQGGEGSPIRSDYLRILSKTGQYEKAAQVVAE